MRRAKFCLILLCALLATGCDKAALEFATKTSVLLKQYESRLAKEIGDSEEYYRHYAAVEVDSLRTRRVAEEDVSRREMADKWSVDYIERQKSASRLREQLLEVAQAQFEISQKHWLNDVDESRAYLEKMEKLQQDKDKVEALGKLLDALAKRRSLVDQGKEISTFVEAIKGELDNRICADINGKLADANTTLERKTALEQLKKDRKCTDN